jgi:hypothetical protein
VKVSKQGVTLRILALTDICNQYATFSREYSAYSPRNSFTSTPPMIIINNNNNKKIIGYLIVNIFDNPKYAQDLV